MAIIRLGPLASGISGKLGGVVFVNGKKSLVVRRIATPRRTTSPFLSRSRAHMSNLQRHWGTLTPLQQDLWNTAARDINSTNTLGEASPMSGFTYFIKTNSVTFVGQRSVVEVPSELTAGNFPVNPSVVFSVIDGLEVSVDNPNSPSFLQIQVYGWPFWKSHDTRDVARLVFLDERSASGDPVQDDVTNEWEDHFGPITENQRYVVGIKTRGSSSPFAPMSVFRQAATA